MILGFGYFEGKLFLLQLLEQVAATLGLQKSCIINVCLWQAVCIQSGFVTAFVRQYFFLSNA